MPDQPLSFTLDGVTSVANEPDADPTVELKVPCEVYSRIVGYMTPVSQWNKGKQQEFADRLVYQVP